jgi:hypothetical protein
LSIDVQLYLLNAGLTGGAFFAAWQAFGLRKTYRSKSSWVGAFTFLSMGLHQAYDLYRLQSAIAEARAKGYMIDHLTTEQWLSGVLWLYVIVAGFILWLHLQHRENVGLRRDNMEA